MAEVLGGCDRTGATPVEKSAPQSPVSLSRQTLGKTVPVLALNDRSTNGCGRSVIFTFAHTDEHASTTLPCRQGARTRPRGVDRNYSWKDERRTIRTTVVGEPVLAEEDEPGCGATVRARLTPAIPVSSTVIHVG